MRGSSSTENVGKRHSRFAAARVLICLSSMVFVNRSDAVLEETVCGWFKERAAFYGWSRAAGRANPNAWKAIAGAQPVSHKTQDGRILRGYKISGEFRDTSRAAPGFMLFAQGNAMLADQLLDILKSFATSDIDVFAYDYRGYGSSEGKPRLKAIVSDYQEIFYALQRVYSGRKHLYGVSFGGIVLLNVIGRGADFDRAVIDSTPSRVSVFGCPKEYDPVLNLPDDGAKLLFIAGNKDTIVTVADQNELLSTAKSRGGRVVIGNEFAHPFVDSHEAVRLKRVNIIKDFLLEIGP